MIDAEARQERAFLWLLMTVAASGMLYLAAIGACYIAGVGPWSPDRLESKAQHQVEAARKALSE